MILDPARRDLYVLADRYARPGAARWEPVPAALDDAIAADGTLAAAARRARRSLIEQVTARLKGLVHADEVARFAAAIEATPRERFLIPEEIGASADDAPSPLDAPGLATVSAPHAYVLTYGLLGLAEGDHLLELGTGTGYGAALASHVVGPRGQVTSIEIDPDLHARARRILAAADAHGPAPITLLEGDARALSVAVVAALAAAPRPLRVAVTYALPEAPEALLARLPEGGRLVAPVDAGPEGQLLLGFRREGGALSRAVHGAVRYVSERT